jgi:hypothetical protein
MVCVVCAVLAERRGVWLVRAQCGYMLSRDNLVNGARRVLVCGGGVLNSGMVQVCRVKCMRGISVCDTKTARNR